MLRSFRDKDTERVWNRQRIRQLDENTQRMALRKLLILDAADALGDLRVPPGNRLEKLKGDRSGMYSIRVNHAVANLLQRSSPDEWCKRS